KALGNLPGGIELEGVAAVRGLLPRAVLLARVALLGLVVTLASVSVGLRGRERPEPHRGEPGIRLKTGRVGIFEQQRERLPRDSGPDVLQVLAELHGFAGCLLYMLVAGEDLERRAKTGEDRIGADDALGYEPG